MRTKRYSETLRNVAPILAEHVDGRELLRAVAMYERANGSECEFDVAEALYWIGNNYHSGQCCPLYAAMCATEFRPGACARGPETVYLYEELAMILA